MPTPSLSFPKHEDDPASVMIARYRMMAIKGFAMLLVTDHRYAVRAEAVGNKQPRPSSSVGNKQPKVFNRK
jgi:hypothetical protein